MTSTSPRVLNTLGGEAWEPISLGSTCATKFQTARRMYVSKYGAGGDLHEFRRSLLTPERGSANYERHVFDWLISPFGAVVFCLQTGFEGAFDRADLKVVDGEATNLRHGFRHPHDFHASDPAVGLTEADIDAQYENARGKFEHLGRRFLALRERPGRYLYVYAGLPYFGHVGRVIAWLSEGAPEHDFHILLVGYEDEDDQPYHVLCDRVSWTRMFRAAPKPEHQQWEGDDDAWDTALAPFRLWPHTERMVRTIDRPDEVQPPHAAGKSERPPLLRRLSGLLGR